MYTAIDHKVFPIESVKLSILYALYCTTDKINIFDKSLVSERGLRNSKLFLNLHKQVLEIQTPAIFCITVSLVIRQ